ncbi:MAG: neutral/alkaline non-lysosomal ceramidase N-terminal domain-containing protein [Myxococcota bacterium]
MIALIAWVACQSSTEPELPAPPAPIESGAPLVGAAEGYLDLPVGTPLAGYTARCSCLGSFGKVDDRASPYATAFIESTGVQTYPTVKVIWLQNGDDNLVITKTDSVYSYDALVAEVTRRLEAETGEVLAGRVIHTANHSHASWGTFDEGIGWYLGSDKFNRENFERMVDRIVSVAVEAYGVREPAKIGVGWATDWDPADEVYRDRRHENDALAPWGADGPQSLGKDPHLGIVRFDTLADEPLAVLVNFGMHGTLSGEDDPLASSDSGGHVETGLEETFGDRKVVTMFTQGAGGDSSPAGQQDGYAAFESVGAIAASKIRAVYDTVTTSADPIRMETASRAIPKSPGSIRVTRDGAVDWSYTPYDPDPNYWPDNLVYGADGQILSPIDEFNTQTGAVFCGSGDIDFPIGGLRVGVFPYDQCLQLDLLSTLIGVFFSEPDIQLPLPETLRASATVSRIGPFPTRLADGTSRTEDWFVGFFPGEPVFSYAEQWRRRTHDELGVDDAMIVGYAQDHEGYLLIPEDWLMGGYEPDIGVFGPLEGEFIMEGVLKLGEDTLLTPDVREDPDPLHLYGATTYPDVPLSTARPDATPDAGERITDVRPYLWTPFLGSEANSPTAAELTVPAQVPRVQGMIQLAWEGGDPGVDAPEVVLERQDGDQWVAVTTPAGRRIDEGRHDILLAETPTPLYPSDAVQTHQWWAGWQAVGHWQDRAGMPLGTYRLRVTGHRYGGSAATWPWDGVPYELATEPFEVVPAAITVTVDDAVGALFASLPAPPHGFRLIALGGDESGDNPIPGPVTVEIETATGTTSDTVDPALSDTRSSLPVAVPADWVSVRVTDAYGNVGVAVRP